MTRAKHLLPLCGLSALLLACAAPAARAQEWSVGAQAVPLVTRADPAVGGEALTEAYLTQPNLMGHLSLGGGRVELLGTLNLEGLTLRRGELNAGIWGEGYVDRRHPHTYLHEVMAVARPLGAPSGAVDASLAVGKGFVPFGTDDPMTRPFVKFPANHHYAQLLERLVAVAAVRGGPVVLEAGLFNGDEPEGPADLPNLGRFGDSWSLRGTLRPLPGLEASASYASVTSPEHPVGGLLDQRKHSAALRWARGAGAHREYALVEWARTDEHDRGRRAFSFSSVLAEAAVRRRGVELAARWERTDRPEGERELDLFRAPVPHHDLHILGVTRWRTLTVGASGGGAPPPGAPPPPLRGGAAPPGHAEGARLPLRPARLLRRGADVEPFGGGAGRSRGRTRAHGAVRGGPSARPRAALAPVARTTAMHRILSALSLGAALALAACTEGITDPPEPPGQGEPGEPQCSATPAEVSASGTLPVLGLGCVAERFTSELWVRGEWAYTGTWGHRGTQPGNVLKVWNVSGSTPVLRDSVAVGQATTLGDVQVSDDGRLLVVATEGGQGSIVVYDLADPARPREVARHSTPSTHAGVHTAELARVGGKLYAFLSVPGPGTVVVVDLSDPRSPREVSVRNAGYPFTHDVFVRDGLLFTAGWDDGTTVWDVGGGGMGGSPENPVHLANVPTLGGKVHNLHWLHDPVTGSKRYLFVGEEGPGSHGISSSGDIHVVDIGDLSAPREVAFYTVPGAGTHNFSVDEPSGVLYAAYYNGGVRALDVRGELGACTAEQKDPHGRCDLGKMGREVGRALVSAPGARTSVWGVQLVGSRLYASDMLNGLWKLDVSALKR